MAKGTRANIGYVYGVMEELQQLREAVDALTEKNRDLAKQLNVSKMELARERKQYNAFIIAQARALVLTQTKRKPVTCSVAVQCDPPPSMSIDDSPVGEAPNLVEGDRTPPRMSWSVFTSPQQSLSPRFKTVRRGLPTEGPMDDAAMAEAHDIDMSSDSSRRSQVSPSEAGMNQHGLTSRAGVSSPRSNFLPQRSWQLRRRNRELSYVEPPLNRKIRRGDYYGLLRRSRLATTLRHKPTRPSPIRSGPEPTISEDHATGDAALVTVPPRAVRQRPAISYAPPKLNTKLRQGDKHTFML